ncbi:hypothetical protein BDF19DRAFT_423190 [Syncephalis fuscata]|nr:hypothetical protein BDF19DRAFT_423190 [Syncephalis fuscata]
MYVLSLNTSSGYCSQIFGLLRVISSLLVVQTLWSSSNNADLFVHAQKLSPVGRWGHTATLAGSSVYFICGQNSNKEYITGDDMVLALDLDSFSDTKNPTWKQIKSLGNGNPNGLSDHNAGYDKSNNRIVVYGGTSSDTSNKKALWDLDISKSIWTADNSNNGPSTRRFNAGGVVADNSLYIMGGAASSTSMGSGFANKYYDEMFSVTFNRLTWQKQPRLLDGKDVIVSIGGNDGSNMISMDKVNVYSKEKAIWTSVTTHGNTPPARREHTAVVSGNNIIIYGGCDQSYSSFYDDVWVLDTNSWTWTQKNIPNSPPGRYEHTATMLGKYMLIGFGFLSDSSADSNIYLLDTQDWQYTTQYSSDAGAGSIVDPGSSGLSSGAIAAIVGGSVVILALSVLAAVIVLRRRRQMREKNQRAPYSDPSGAKSNAPAPSWQSRPNSGPGNATNTAAEAMTDAGRPTSGPSVSFATTAGAIAGTSAGAGLAYAAQNNSAPKAASPNSMRYSTDYPNSMASQDNATSAPIPSNAPLPSGLTSTNSSDWTLAPQRPVSPPVAPKTTGGNRYSNVSSIDGGLSPVPVSKGKSPFDSYGSARPDSDIMAGTQFKRDHGSSLLGPNSSNGQLNRESWLTNDSYTANESSGQASGRLQAIAHSPTFRASYSIQEEANTMANATANTTLSDEQREAELEALANERSVYITTGPKQALRVANPDSDSE